MRKQVKNSDEIHNKCQENSQYLLRTIKCSEIEPIKSTRKLTNKHRALSGRIINKRHSNEYASFESSLERDMAYRLEMDFDVQYYVDQPFKIEYYDNNDIARSYTPDFFVGYKKNFSEKKDTIIEVKFREELRNDFGKFKDRFKAAKRFAQENNCEFQLLTEIEIRNDYLLNAKFLNRFILARFNDSTSQILLSAISVHEWTTPNQLINELSRSDEHKAELLHHLWHLIAQGTIECDLYEELNMQSKIWISF